MSNNYLIAAIAVVLLPLTGRAQQEGPAPIGTWTGVTPNGVQVVLELANNGRFIGDDSSSGPVSGQWYWQPSPGGGLLTLVYNNRGGSIDTINARYLGSDRMNLVHGNMWVTLQRH